MSQKIHVVDLITEYATSNPEDSNIHGQYRENVKAHSVIAVIRVLKSDNS